jgi:tetratricopeptide (TPR) repeat protein
VVGAVLQYLVLQKRMDDAATVIEGMAKGAPESPEIFYAAAIVYFEKGQMDRALENFKSVSTDSRFYKNALMHMSIIYYKQKDFDSGIAVLEQAMPGLPTPDKLELIPYLSSFYKEKGMADAALALLQEGIGMDPENTDLMFELGVIHDRQGNADLALEQMQTVVKLDPEHADALNYIGYSYADKGIRLDEAEAMIKKALALKPDNGYIIDSLGWVYFRQGRLDEALAELQRAVALIPEDPVVLEHLGDIYAKRNDPAGARKYYEQALSAPDADQEKLRKKIDALNPGGNERP